jgi:putative flippase GtrA
MIRHFASRQFLGFVGVGVTAAAANWLARIVAGQWMSFVASLLVAYGIGMAVAFVLNAIFVFPGSAVPLPRRALQFIAVNLAFLPVVFGGALAFEPVLRWLGMPRFTESTAHALALAIPMCATFLIHKFVTFKGARNGR